MKKKPHATLAVLAGILLLMAAPTCYFIAERDNPNDPVNIPVDMGLPVADTGQTLCYDSDGYPEIPCDENATGWPRQDGFYANKPNARSFTGPTHHPTFTSDYTTKDNVTGLVWKSCSEGLSGSNCGTGVATQYLWVNDLTACIELNSLNSGAGYAGRTTWRLPTVAELSTLTNYGRINPAIDTVHFPNTNWFRYWSSSIDVDIDDNAWGVGFTIGYVESTPKANWGNVRCVADGP
ncbi:MAG TPA: DUF1566 domain-containing protein [Spirochaetota bacterium]|nr:DUF1566 domain-containing protein [Spirochaetota bacterium]